MSNEKNINNSMDKNMRTPANMPSTAENSNCDEQQNGYVGNSGQTYAETDINAPAQDNYEEKHKKKKLEKPLKIFGGICIALALATIVFSPFTSVDKSELAENALKDKVSTAISAGTVLLAKDEDVTPQDYTIKHKGGSKDTKIWVWDYAAEDGDYVQVLVNGVPVSDSFMIKHKPKELVVPSTGEVQIKGIRDGGGGITYAVRYEINGTTYFNGAKEGEFNTYTLTEE